MPPKDPRAEFQTANAETSTNLKRIERFLRLLTWQMFFLLAILFYLAVRPQPGRYQFTVTGEDVVVFDTASSRALAVRLQKQVLNPPGGTPGSAASPAAPDTQQ